MRFFDINESTINTIQCELIKSYIYQTEKPHSGYSLFAALRVKKEEEIEHVNLKFYFDLEYEIVGVMDTTEFNVSAGS